MNVVFRTDANAEIGLGHIVRCLALASAVAEAGGKCWFLCAGSSEWLRSLVTSRGHTFIDLHGLATDTVSGVALSGRSSADHDWQEDAAATRSSWPLIDIDWLVVDHYGLGIDWEGEVSNLANRMIVIDDLASRAHACHMLVDATLGRIPCDYNALVPEDCEVMAGAAYVLLRTEFRRARMRSITRRRANGHEIRSIVITLGGSDAQDLTSRILERIESILQLHDFALHIVLGAACPWLKRVTDLTARSTLDVTLHHNISDMATLFADSDLCIGAAGGTALERCVLGLPTILLIVAENQRAGGIALMERGACVLVDDIEELAKATVSLIDTNRHSHRLEGMSQAALSICDAWGSDRVFSRMQKMTADGHPA